jgi:hypothetical protein
VCCPTLVGRVRIIWTDISYIQIAIGNYIIFSTDIGVRVQMQTVIQDPCIYYYIIGHITWHLALEYSSIPCNNILIVYLN